LSNLWTNIYSKKMNSSLGWKLQYSVTICIDSIQNRPNSLWQTKYHSYLHSSLAALTVGSTWLGSCLACNKITSVKVTHIRKILTFYSNLLKCEKSFITLLLAWHLRLKQSNLSRWKAKFSRWKFNKTFHIGPSHSAKIS
jgi:hypothetical protein